ncbi:MAG: iron-sulfur cluster assembly scaffold protein [Patescibacteria group bacterium]
MESLYREELLEHIKNPLNKGLLSSPDAEVIEKNPMCGDIIKMQIKVAEGKVAEIGYDGEACGVCIAAASILTDKVLHEKFDINIAKGFSKQDLLDLIGIELTTSRIKCAMLPLEALKNSIKIYEQK